MRELEESNSVDLIAETLARLERPGLTRESIALLVMKLLELRNPDKTVVMPEDAEINLVEPNGSRTQIFIHNLLAECGQDPTARVEIVERYLRGLSPDSRDTDQPARREDVVALVRDFGYWDSVQADSRCFAARHLIGDLWIVYGVDHPDSTTVLRSEEVSELGISSNEIEALSLSNLDRLLGDLEFESFGELFLLVSQNNSEYRSATLLLDYIWSQAKALVEGDVVVAIPARDTVIFTGTLNVEGLRELREQAEYVVRNGNHVISTTLLRRDGEAWKLFS